MSQSTEILDISSEIFSIKHFNPCCRVLFFCGATNDSTPFIKLRLSCLEHDILIPQNVGRPYSIVSESNHKFSFDLIDKDYNNLTCEFYDQFDKKIDAPTPFLLRLEMDKLEL